jgi:hypothetical protein
MTRRTRETSGWPRECADFVIQYVHAKAMAGAFGQPLLQRLRFSSLHPFPTFASRIGRVFPPKKISRSFTRKKRYT